MSRSVQCLGGRYGTDFDARRWWSLSAMGTLGLCTSLGTHVFAARIVLEELQTNRTHQLVTWILYVPCLVLALVSLLMASTTNPGAVPLGARPLTVVRPSSSIESRKAVRRCQKCQDNYKPPRAHHDSVTGRCIVKFDHYCPWINNAVGALNHKFFCLFLLYTAFTCCVALLLLALRYVECNAAFAVAPQQPQETTNVGANPQRRYLQNDNNNNDTNHCATFYQSHWTLALLVVSIVFLVFTTIMGCEQLEAIESGKGKIARMKMSVGETGTEYSRVTEEFNEMFGGTSPHASWHWFLPLPVTFPRGMRTVVLGYEWDERSQGVAFEEDDDDEDDVELLAQPTVPASAPIAVREHSGESVGSATSSSVKNRSRGSSSREDQGALPNIV